MTTRVKLEIEYDIVSGKFYPPGGKLPFRVLHDLTSTRATSVSMDWWALQRAIEQGEPKRRGLSEEFIEDLKAKFTHAGGVVRKAPPRARKMPKVDLDLPDDFLAGIDLKL